ncbi:MAG: helix-turn-helix transcriptional regulator [Clostridia bacterium]|nr:helix-turn-helix transcriptional regulator [Clostridia bacterium]
MKLKIKEFREEMHLTQNELAQKIENVQRNVSNWENGTSEPDCETILKLAEFFDITIDELFGKNSSISSSHPVTGVELTILKFIRKLTDPQKFALLQFLRELKNE